MVELIREFFAINRVVILFVYGQVFFVLGLVITLQSWRHSRLPLAYHLKWLAAFGFTHGFHEWGDVFIPVQSQLLGRPFVEFLLVIQAFLLAISFTCLFQFGVESLRPLPDRWGWLRYVPSVGLAIWVIVALGPLLSISESQAWYRLNNILARYSLGFPGALLAAYGLRHQAATLIAPLQVPHIWRTLRLAGLALAGYAVFGGLFVPPGHFFPANWLNSELLEQWTLVPVQVYRGGLGLILALAIIRALEVFRVELDRRLGSLEEAQVLIAERERIGRELHDGTLQTIYAAGLLLRTSEKEMRQQDCPERSLARVQQSVSLLDEAVSDIRSYIGSLRSQPSSRSLASSLRELALADHLRSLVEVNLAVNLPEDQPLSPAQVGHLLAITNEAISNVVRHAQARQLFLTADLVQNQLVLKVEDNGQGLPHDYVVGYGLRNMRDRARMLGGEMTFVSKPGQGATVTIIVPWDEHDEQTKDFVG